MARDSHMVREWNENTGNRGQRYELANINNFSYRDVEDLFKSYYGQELELVEEWINNFEQSAQILNLMATQKYVFQGVLKRDEW